MSESIIYREPAPGWMIVASASNAFGCVDTANGDGWDDVVYTDQSIRAAYRYTWERWALGELGPLVESDCESFMGWRQNRETGWRAVEFESGVALVCRVGKYWIHLHMEDYADPVAALAAAALESIRRRL